MSGNEQVMLMLGQIRGQLDGLSGAVTKIDSTVEKIDGRLRKVEMRAAINGGITGGVAGVGLSLLTAKLKATLGL